MGPKGFYCVMARIESMHDGWCRSYGVPTFYLDPHQQGIHNLEHAESIARDIVGAFARETTDIVHLSVCFNN